VGEELCDKGISYQTMTISDAMGQDEKRLPVG